MSNGDDGAGQKRKPGNQSKIGKKSKAKNAANSGARAGNQQIALSSRTLDVRRDSADFRDRIYQPALVPLSKEMIPESNLLTIRDQGQEGAWVDIRANAGAFYRKRRVLVLFGSVNIYHFQKGIAVKIPVSIQGIVDDTFAGVYQTIKRAPAKQGVTGTRRR